MNKGSFNDSCFVECPPRVPNRGNNERVVETVETISAELTVGLRLNCYLSPTTHGTSLMRAVRALKASGAFALPMFCTKNPCTLPNRFKT